VKNFDLKDLVYVPVPTAAVPELPPGGVRVRPEHPPKGQFIRVPHEWRRQLVSARSSGTTWTVATHLLHQRFKNHSDAIRLANGALASDGVSRHQKWVALSELERLGLISVERRPRKSPIVTLLHMAVGR
jgi:hypothetical protein